MTIEPFWLTLKLSASVTVIDFFVALPWAIWLSGGKGRIKAAIESLLSLPLVLPPVVLGFYLLLLMSPESFLGELIMNSLGIRLVFNFTGILIAGVVFTFPLMLAHLKSGFSAVDAKLVDASYMLGKTPTQTFWYVMIPASYTSVIAALISTFAHMTGAFGVVLMVGGNIPGRTKVASVAIYDMVESLEYTHAHILSLCLIGVSFLVLFTVNVIHRSRSFV